MKCFILKWLNSQFPEVTGWQRIFPTNRFTTVVLLSSCTFALSLSYSLLLIPASFSFADVYSTLEPNDRVGDGKGPVVERDALQVIWHLDALIDCIQTASWQNFVLLIYLKMNSLPIIWMCRYKVRFDFRIAYLVSRYSCKWTNTSGVHISWPRR